MIKNKELVFDFLNELDSEGIEGFVVGGASRAIILGVDIDDIDIAVKADKDKLLEVLNKYEIVDLNGAYYGVYRIKYHNEIIEVSLLRKEGEYIKFRRPQSVEFIKDLKIDSWRRDLTINSLYIDKNGNVYDYHNGLDDLKMGIIRMIGDSDKRLKEDALRIIRAIRFMIKLDFKLDESLIKAIKDNKDLVYKLPKGALLKEKEKLLKLKDLDSLEKIFEDLGISMGELYGKF